MKFGNDIFLWFRFLTGIFKLLKEIFGDDDDKDDIQKNGL